MSPFGIESLPAEGLKLLRTLPLIAERLQEVASHTRVLAAVREDLGEVRRAVESVPPIETAVKEIAADTSTLPEVGRGITALSERIAGLERQMTTVEDAMPELVEVQRHLAALPETMQGLDAGINGLTELLTQLVTSLANLDANVAALQESMEPVGRLADKLPGGSRRG